MWGNQSKLNDFEKNILLYVEVLEEFNTMSYSRHFTLLFIGEKVREQERDSNKHSAKNSSNCNAVMS